MFFNTKRSPRKTTHQTLSTEQLEQKAMFSVSPVEPVVALDVGPVNQTGYEFQAKDVALVKTYCSGYCFADTDGFMKIGEILTESGLRAHPGGDGLRAHPGGDGLRAHPGGTGLRNPVDMFRSIPCYPEFFKVAEGEDGRSIVHPQFNVGGTSGPGGTSFMTDTDGRSIVHPQFNVGLNVLAQANQQPSLTAIRDVDIASESLGGSADPGGDDIFMPKPNRIAGSAGPDVDFFMPKPNRITGSADPGGDDVFMPKPNRVGGSADPGGDDIFMPKPNRTDVWTNGSATSVSPNKDLNAMTSIVNHPASVIANLKSNPVLKNEPANNLGYPGSGTEEVMNFISVEKIGEPQTGYAEAVGLDSSTLENSSSDSYSEVEWTYFAARQEVFARMGR